MRLSWVTTIAIALLPGLAHAQSRQPDPWRLLRPFVGSWAGDETGSPGVGKGERIYEFVIDGHFLHFRNISRFEPQERNPEGETHEDWGFFSYDLNRERIVLRQFFIEAFVIKYVLASEDEETGRLVFLSEDVENAPPGFRARYIITRRHADEFEEVFELANPDEDFGELIRSVWTREQL